MNTYKLRPHSEAYYVLELSKEDAYIVASALRDCHFDDSALGDRAESMGSSLQLRMEIEGDWGPTNAKPPRS